MKILAIDPGSSQSGFVIYDTTEKKVLQYGKIINRLLIPIIKEHKETTIIEKPDFISVGAGKEVINTIFWAGRFFQSARLPLEFGRNEVKKAHGVKNDKQVRDLIKLHYNVKLSQDSWQAFFLIFHYVRVFN